MQKRILIAASIYGVLHALLSNSYLLWREYTLGYVIAAFLFIAMNIGAGMLLMRTRSKRLRFLCHGTVLLLAFCLSVIYALVVHIMLLFGIGTFGWKAYLLSALFCTVLHFLLFWNGILCVYLTSIQIGIKIRVIGALCGMIPIANLVALSVILRKTVKEVSFEAEKEALNEKRKDEKLCATRYPILFVHGVFFRDFEQFNYWGRIPAEVEKNGATVYYGKHSSALPLCESAKELSARIREIVETTGCEKVNIVAHSKGGLDSRYAMEYCGVAPMVASLTTINTPHRGCMFADHLLTRIPKKVKNRVASSYNKAAHLLGDPDPDFLSAVENLTASFCTAFDAETKMPEGVYCQSVGSVMRHAATGKFPLNMSYPLVKYFDGGNDGLVGEDSFRWGEDYMLLNLPLKRGISHADMIDLNRENLDGFDVREFYVQLLYRLKQKGL